ncbi:hypothetical protein AIA94_23920 [Salmonella enterica subsp. enterica]|nr:hypothetical protein [Salmonella enterica subsp. enterica]EDQ6108050.1 hypothetical protein [Salmonella enterica subsp. enterica]
MFENLHKQLSAGIKKAIDDLLVTLLREQRSLFYLLKECPPSATAISIKRYMKRYYVIDNCELDTINAVIVEPVFMTYLYKLVCRYFAKDIKHFKAKTLFFNAMFFIRNQKDIARLS